MKVFFFPIVSISIFFCIGIIIFFYTNTSWLTIILILLFNIITSLILLKFLAQNKLLKTLTLLLFWIGIGLLTSKIHNVIDYKNHYSKFLNNSIEKKTTNLILSEKLKPSATNNKYYATVSSINNNKTIGKIIVYIPKQDTLNYNIGDILLANSAFNEITEPKNPYEFSYAGYLQKQHIFHQLFLKDDFIKIGIEKNLDYYVNILREILIDSFKKHEFKTDTQQFINAFIFGQRQELSTKINNDYTDAGVVHILAISGLHIAILYALILQIFKTLRWGYNKRYLKLTILLLFLWTFALITGMSASVVRSVTMFSIIAIAMTFDRNQNIYNAMGISFLAILIFKPYFIFDVGFQLSYLSVFIIILCNPLYKKLHFTKYKIIHLAMDTISISLCAQLFLLPLILYYFHQFPTLFLIANLIVIPLSNLILYGLVLLLILNFTIPNIALYLGKLLDILITYLNKYIEWIASFKAFNIQNIPFNSILLCTSYVIIILVLINIFNSNYNRFKLLLASIILFQLGFIYNVENKKNIEEFIVWNQSRNTVITNETSHNITIYTSNNLQIDRFVNNISHNNFSKEINIQSLKNYFIIGENKILLIDSNQYYKSSLKPDIIILVNAPKINLDRLLNTYNPKIIIADASNYKSYVQKWRQTSIKKNIPFHSTYEMGYYSISK